FDRSQRLLNDSGFCVSAARLVIFTRRNSEKQDRLQPEILSAAHFVDNFFYRQLKNSRHTADRAALFQFFAHEQRQNKVVNGQMRLTNEVSQGSGTPQATRSMNQSSHRARLPARRACRKPTIPSVYDDLDGAERWVSASYSWRVAPIIC